MPISNSADLTKPATREFWKLQPAGTKPMNLALDRYADNPIIDELVCWPPSPQKIKSIRACCPMFRKPFIEIEMSAAETVHRHFPKESFSEHWAEAMVILQALTDIKLVTDFDYEPYGDRDTLVQAVLKTRQECIDESNQMFESGLYQPFLNQYGEDCKNLPADADEKIAEARQKLTTTS